jgi:23S rRNA (guanosine2251-2'-O)-methyltransferase
VPLQANIFRVWQKVFLWGFFRLFVVKILPSWMIEDNRGVLRMVVKKDKKEWDRRNKEYGMKKPLDEEESDNGIAYGRNIVAEILKSGKPIDKLFVQSGEREGSITVLVAKAKNAGIPIVEVTKEKLDNLTGGGKHQGVVAMVPPIEYVTVEDILRLAEEKGEDPFLVILDNVEDPHNLGAIIRCAEGAGAHGILIPKRHAAPITATVRKSSAGALEHIAIAKVPNLVYAIEDLKKRGLWIYGAEADGNDLYATSLKGPTAFVVGSEGNGISRLVREKCDFVLSIPMYGQVNSFNVSCAAAVVLCKASHDRHGC